MKNIKLQSIYIIIFLLIGLITQSATAQKDSQYFLLTTWELQFPEDGDHEELYYLLAEWHEKIVLRNPKIVSEKTLMLNSENETSSWVIITEYTSKDDINSVAEMEEKLIAEGWPVEAERKVFFQLFNKYAITHSEGTLLGIPSIEQDFLSFE